MSLLSIKSNARLSYATDDGDKREKKTEKKEKRFCEASTEVATIGEKAEPKA